MSHHVEGEPAGYVAWFEWAAEKGKTHKQVRCEGCGLFKVWIPRDRATNRGATP